MARVLEGVGPGQAPGLAITLFPRVDAFASVADTAPELVALRDRLVLILNRAVSLRLALPWGKACRCRTMRRFPGPLSPCLCTP